MNTTKVKATTKKGQGIIDDLKRTYYGYDIYDAYNKPSRAKVEAFRRIEERAKATAGYNHNLHLVGANSCTFSTIYSVSNDDGTTSIIKDTRDNVYEVII